MPIDRSGLADRASAYGSGGRGIDSWCGQTKVIKISTSLELPFLALSIKGYN